MKRVLLLGATGSIGMQFIDALEKNLINAKLTGVVSYQNEEKLRETAIRYSVPYFIIKDKDDNEKRAFLDSVQGDIALNALSSSEGLFWSLETIERNMDLALANKESVVMGYPLLRERAKNKGKKILPVDSEHSALWYLLKHEKPKRLIITCSGGPFLHKDLKKAKLEDALKHPNWNMGKKITIDSATLANKGLEVIEASYLFGYKAEDISVVIHRESMVHAMIEKHDGSILMYMSKPDMRLPISLSILNGEENDKELIQRVDFSNLTLHFEKPNFKKFEMLSLAYKALKSGGAYTIAYNAANEVAVSAFLEKKISLLEIPKMVKNTMHHDFKKEPKSYNEIMDAHKKALRIAKELI